MATRFAAEGASVVAGDWNAERLDAAVAGIGRAGGTIVGAQGDIADQATAEGLVDLAVSTYGRLDVLVNNAGVMDYMQGVGEVADDIWRRVLGINLDGPMFTMRRAVPTMVEQGGGAIVNIASTAGIHGGAAGAAYTASKHALVGLTRNTAWMYATAGVRCNAICPGATATNIAETMPPERLDPAGAARAGAYAALMPGAARPGGHRRAGALPGLGRGRATSTARSFPPTRAGRRSRRREGRRAGDGPPEEHALARGPWETGAARGARLCAGTVGRRAARGARFVAGTARWGRPPGGRKARATTPGSLAPGGCRPGPRRRRRPPPRASVPARRAPRLLPRRPLAAVRARPCGPLAAGSSGAPAHNARSSGGPLPTVPAKSRNPHGAPTQTARPVLVLHHPRRQPALGLQHLLQEEGGQLQTNGLQRGIVPAVGVLVRVFAQVVELAPGPSPA